MRISELDGCQFFTAQLQERANKQLKCHEMAVLLCDQRMPAMTGIEFVDDAFRQ